MRVYWNGGREGEVNSAAFPGYGLAEMLRQSQAGQTGQGGHARCRPTARDRIGAPSFEFEDPSARLPGKVCLWPFTASQGRLLGHLCFSLSLPAPLSPSLPPTPQKYSPAFSLIEGF